jgi:hypothetical protein
VYTIPHPHPLHQRGGRISPRIVRFFPLSDA